jgi:hypothetical protein
MIAHYGLHCTWPGVSTSTKTVQCCVSFLSIHRRKGNICKVIFMYFVSLIFPITSYIIYCQHQLKTKAKGKELAHDD